MPAANAGRISRNPQVWPVASRRWQMVILDSADRVVKPCHCQTNEQVYLAGEWIQLDVRDRRCHPDQLSPWAQEGIRRHDEKRKRARAWMTDPANAEAVEIIRAMLDGRPIP